jgi:hypothetical protein
MLGPIRYTSRADLKGPRVQKPPQPKPTPPDAWSPERRRQERKRQIVGITAGIGIGMLLLAVFPTFQAAPGTIETVLWSAAIGGLVASFAAFERAGAALTRSRSRILNLAVAFGIVLLFFLLLIFFLR